jgi:hypothetical protein
MTSVTYPGLLSTITLETSDVAVTRSYRSLRPKLKALVSSGLAIATPAFSDTVLVSKFGSIVRS